MNALVLELLEILEQLDNSGYYSYDELEVLQDKAIKIRSKLSEMVVSK